MSIKTLLHVYNLGFLQHSLCAVSTIMLSTSCVNVQHRWKVLEGLLKGVNIHSIPLCMWKKGGRREESKEGGGGG